ncbi:unnamed protein product [Closterium sp. Naga37s-1]|nr:unnamed protein product [Closterium sp. Naga37s-1]
MIFSLSHSSHPSVHSLVVECQLPLDSRHANWAEAIQPARRFAKAPDYSLITPILYAPLFPLIRITLRHKPKLRDRLFVTAVASAFLHGAYMNYRFYNAESYQQSQRT